MCFFYKGAKGTLLYSHRRHPGTAPAHICLIFCWLGGGGGGGGGGGRLGGLAPLVNFCILEVATQIVLETIFEMLSVLNWS